MTETEELLKIRELLEKQCRDRDVPERLYSKNTGKFITVLFYTVMPTIFMYIVYTIILRLT